MDAGRTPGGVFVRHGAAESRTASRNGATLPLGSPLLIGLLDGNVRDLPVWRLALAPGSVLKSDELELRGASLRFIIEIVLLLAIEVLNLSVEPLTFEDDREIGPVLHIHPRVVFEQHEGRNSFRQIIV